MLLEKVKNMMTEHKLKDFDSEANENDDDLHVNIGYFVFST